VVGADSTHKRLITTSASTANTYVSLDVLIYCSRLAVWRVRAIAPSFIFGWRAFSSVSLCESILFSRCPLPWQRVPVSVVPVSELCWKDRFFLDREPCIGSLACSRTRARLVGRLRDTHHRLHCLIL
jgi:hypothetical protein